MRDKRKIVFCLIIIIITIVAESFLFKSANKMNDNYKSSLKKNLSSVVTELETREFTSEIDYTNGILEYERKKDGYEYGYIYIDYDLNCNIENVELELNYSGDLYIDDIFYDAYYIFNLLGFGLVNEYKFESDLADNFSIKDNISINEKNYTLDISKTEDNKIRFEIK